MSGAIAKENVFLVFLPREKGQTLICQCLTTVVVNIHMVHDQCLSGVLLFANL